MVAIRYSDVVLITGAGASRAAKVPAFAEYWTVFREKFGIDSGPYRSSLPITESQWVLLTRIVDEERKKSLDPPHFNDIESIFRCLRLKQVQLGAGFSSGITFGDSCLDSMNQLRDVALVEHQLRRHFLAAIDVQFRLERTDIKSVVQRSSTGKAISRADYEGYCRLFKLADRQVPLDVFTLNCDLFLEWLCRKARQPIADGFASDGTFDDGGAVYLRAVGGMRIFKLHGSIDWRASADFRTASKGPASGSLKAILFPGHIASKVADTPLIWPGVYDEYEGVLSTLRNVHFRNAILGARVLLVIGYRMGDIEICKTLMAALEENYSAIVKIVFPDKLQSAPSLFQLHERFRSRTEVISSYFPEVLDDRFITALRV